MVIWPPVTCSGAAYFGVSATPPSRVSVDIPLSSSSEQLGDAEVEQLDLAVVGHEHVRRLQVAVDDQVGVGVRDGRLHVQEQADALLDAEALVVAEAIDVLAVDVLEHQVRLTGARHPGVDQPGDVRVRQPGEDRPLALEPGLPFPARRATRSAA